MELNIKVKDISAGQLEKIGFKCLDYNYWFGYRGLSFMDELPRARSFGDIKCFIKGRLFQKKSSGNGRKKFLEFKVSGGKLKGAFTGRRCIGVIMAGDYYLFPRLKSFSVYPPDFKSAFLACIYVIPEYRDMGIDKRLLIEIEKELIREKVKSIEAIGKRIDDDLDEEEYENIPLVPFKSLINNGFYLKKNDPLYPLLRLDLKNIAFDFAESRTILGKIALKEEVKSPIIMKDK
ncbi:MAG: GNAT family N-acetyltransferase [Actinomycetota bacterium]|nr:GNAT family N-acetyltransferase [Actinomycetota bacterium]